jgi:sulfite exporter TauE/SafE
MAVSGLLFSTLAMAFVTGLVSSFGHCLGMCGGIVALYSARQPLPAAGPVSKPGLAKRAAGLLPLHMGRLATYILLGALVGFASALLDRAGTVIGWQGAFSVLVGIAMLLVGLSLLGILPPVEMALASATAGSSPLARMRSLLAKPGLFSSLALGFLWGFLPCGLVFAMLVVSARTQTAWGGALTMLAFGLGTIPTLLGFGLAANLLSPRLRGRLQGFAGLLILVFAIQTILRGLAVANLIPPMVIGPVMLW